ncbi:GNAT family N-acetyltransferase [Catenulispora yoronensis]
MLAELPRPLFTVVDEGDDDLTAAWLVAGFSIGRRERGYVLPTDPRVSGLASVGPPSGVRIVPAGAADTDALRALDSVIRAEIAATVGWQTMPVEVLHRPHGILAEDLPKFVVAAQGTEYVGLVRLVTATRQPRIGLLAVRADHRRRGIARALLAHVLGDLHVRGTAAAWAEINEANTAAAALVEGPRRATPRPIWSWYTNEQNQWRDRSGGHRDRVPAQRQLHRGAGQRPQDPRAHQRQDP